jgi:hypothetical protein
MAAVRPMFRCRVFLVGWLAFLAVGVGASQAAWSQTIYAYFDVDGGLQFRYADSTNVGTTIPPGTYTINLNNNGSDDLGIDHIFHIFGPGVDYKAANVDTQATFTATFQAGATYTIQDDLDPKDIHQTLLATNAPPASSGTSTTTPTSGSTKPTSSDIVGSEVVPFRGALEAIVFGDGAVSLTRNGKKVASLKAGRYTFFVDDESKTRGFSVQGLTKTAVAVTSRKFTGTKDVTIALKPGRWSFFAPGANRHVFAVVG